MELLQAIEKIDRNKVRFELHFMNLNHNNMTREDLWDISIEALDDMYKKLVKVAKESVGEGLLSVNTKADDILESKMLVIKHVFQTRSAEAEAIKNERVNRERKNKIMAILEEKQEGSLRNMSIEELQAELNS